MLKILLILSILTISLNANNGVEIISSGPEELIISFSPSLKGFDKIKTVENNISYYPKFSGAIPMGDVAGEPYHFAVPVLVSVPSENGYSIEIISTPDYQLVDNLLPPVPQEDNLYQSDVVYKTSENYFNAPQPPIFSSEYLGVSAGQPVLKLNLLAAFFNSAKQKTSITERLILKIKFDVSKANSNITQNDFHNTINSEVIANWESLTKNKKSQNQLQTITNVSSGNWLKVTVDKENLYKITKENLSSMGFDLTSDDAKSLKLFGYGGIPMDEHVENDDWESLPENEIVVKTDANGNFIEAIFYANDAVGFKPSQKGAENYINWYSQKNHYILTWGGLPGKRASYQKFDGAIINQPSIYKQHSLYHEEKFNLDPSGSGRQMVGNLISSGKKYEQQLYNLDRTGEITYRVAIAHKSSSNAVAYVNENGTEVGNLRLLDIPTGSYMYADRPSKYLTAPASNVVGNKSVIDINYVGNPTDSPYMDYIEIHYPREFVAINNRMSFFSDYELEAGTQFNLSGFSGNELYVVNVTDSRNPVFLNNYGSNSNPIIKFNADQVNKFFVSSDFKSPVLENINFANLRSDPLNTDVIVITDNELLNSANKFKEYRESNSDLSVSVVSTQSIYNEFGCGVKDIASIRNFLKYSYLTWSNTPKYVLFWGDAHSDNRNLSIKDKIYVPLYHSADSLREMFATSTTAHDDFFIRVDGEDDLIDMISGRVPLHPTSKLSADQLGELYVKKIEQYEHNSSTGNWRNNITLVADDGLQGDGSNDGNAHIKASEDLTDVDNMEKFVHSKVYLIEYQTELTSDGRRKPNANNDILTAINDKGSLILNWSGHGNPYVWAHENVFNQNESLDKLNNGDKLFFATAATCSFGQFDNFNGTIAAEELLFMENSGAVALFAATRLVYAIQNGTINELYFQEILKRNSETGLYPSVGEALFNVKQILNKTNDEKYLILGDPTIKLLIPDYQVVIDSFPDTDLPTDPESPMILKGLSKVKVKGHINTPNGSFDPSFNGQLEFSIFDGDRSYEIEELKRFYFFNKYGGILNKSTTDVTDGSFEIDFIIPKDISFSENLGRMFAYASSNDSTKFAKGNFNNFRIYGIDTNSFNDDIGPEIKIYLDSRKFIQGDIVSRNPLLIIDLFDSLGINSTGVGIGHRIEAWVNDSPNSLDMTNNYTTLNGSNQQGTSNIQLNNLQPGLNKVTVRAWDLFNNFETATTYFYIPDNASDIRISDIKNYPNPFSDNTTIQVKHNLEPGFDYSINIYDIEGHLVRTFDGRDFSRQILEVFWDGTAQNGEPIMSGSYLIQVNVKSINGYEKNNAGIVSIKVQ
ncbi:type IX secretion system sortase PorU [Candidatus Kapabacteria bacterium]|nr:type IX secretion system sortase PorU [Candidatus Kapabacteria bacterium]